MLLFGIVRSYKAAFSLHKGFKNGLAYSCMWHKKLVRMNGSEMTFSLQTVVINLQVMLSSVISENITTWTILNGVTYLSSISGAAKLVIKY